MGEMGEMSEVPRSTVLLDLSTVAGLLRTLVDDALDGLEARSDFLTYTLLAALDGAGPTELARHEGVPLTTASDRLNRLVQKGHAERVPHPSDGRAATFRLTDEGWQAFRKAQPHFREVLDGVQGRLDMPLDEIRAALASVERALRAELNEKKTPTS